MRAPPTISAVVCTYNGERYVGEQLASIVGQRRPPDEILVADDGSTDATLTIVDDVLRSTTIHSRTITAAPASPLGTTANFERAAKAATCEVIAFADQDDVWLPHKLERAEALMRTTGADLVFSDAYLINETGARTGRRFWDTVSFDSRRQAGFRSDPLSVLLRSNPVCGAAMLVRRTAVAAAMPFTLHALHDQWLALVVAVAGRIEAVADPLLEYRMHSANQVGVAGRTPWRRLSQRRAAGPLGDEFELFSDLLRRTSELLSSEDRARMEEKLAHLRHRATLPDAVVPRLAACLKELAAGRYFRYSRGIESFAFDALLRPRRERLVTR